MFSKKQLNSKSLVSKFILAFLLINVIYSNLNLNKLKQAPTIDSKCCEMEHTIVMNGNAMVSVPSNIIRVGFTITTLKMEANNALRENSNIGNEVNKLFNKLEIPEGNITTVNFQILPQYNYYYNTTTNENQETFKGFQVTNQIDVKLSNKEMATQLVDQLTQLGVNKINYLNFEVEQNLIDEAKRGLLTKALQDARDQAEILAKNSGLNIVDIKTMSLADVSVNNPTPTYAYARMALADSRSPTIYANSFDIKATVSVTFLIKKQ